MAAEYGFSKIEDLYAALGYGKFSARQVLHKLAPGSGRGRGSPTAAAEIRQAGRRIATVDGKAGKNGDLVIQVKGIDDLLVYRAKCCNPIRGESIVGYVTRGKGVAVHSIIAPTCRT